MTSQYVHHVSFIHMSVRPACGTTLEGTPQACMNVRLHIHGEGWVGVQTEVLQCWTPGQDALNGQVRVTLVQLTMHH